MIKNESSSLFSNHEDWHDAAIEEGASRFERGDYYEIATHENCELIGVFDFEKSSGEIFEYSTQDEFLDEADDAIYYLRRTTRPGMSMKKFLFNVRELLNWMRWRRKFQKVNPDKTK